MWRAVVLSLCLLVSLGLLVPFLTDSAEAGPRKQYRKKSKKVRYKKYSKAWWRAYHRKQRSKKMLLARKRSLRLRRQRLAMEYNGGQTPPVTGDQTSNKGKTSLAVLPSGRNAPAGWKSDSANKSVVQFRVDDTVGNPLGSASISVVGPAIGADSDSFRNKAVGGVSTGALRRTVIDRMMKEDGWVVNDYEKNVSGKKVYVVVAQSRDSNNRVQSRRFYFTEVEGKIYSVATIAPNESSEQIAEESEKVINLLSGRPVRADLR